MSWSIKDALVKGLKLYGSVYRRNVILKAGTNVTITESTSGDVATLEFAASGGGGGSGDVVGPSSSVASEIALFDGTTGKLLKRATTTGLLKGTSGVLSAATQGTDYYAPGGTDVAVADGGTGASTASGARTNLGLVIGTDVMGWDAQLAAVAATTPTAGGMTVWSSVSAAADLPISAVAGAPLSSSGTAPTWAPYFRGGSSVDYGNGRDGNVAFDASSNVTINGATITPSGGVYTLSQSADIKTATFSGGAVVRTNGWEFRCWRLTGTAGVIHDDGNAAALTVRGAALASSDGPLGRASSAGATGVTTTLSVGTAGNSTGSPSLGGAGGAGGARAGGIGGGAGGTTTAPTAMNGNIASGNRITTGYFDSTGGSPGATAVRGGGGGGSGACTGTGNSGGGGGGGGFCRVFALVSDWSAGTVRANGGAGGNAAGGDNGGGGGGGGGCCMFVTDYPIALPTVQANGGAGGLKSGTGTDGATGSAGTAYTITTAAA